MSISLKRHLALTFLALLLALEGQSFPVRSGGGSLCGFLGANVPRHESQLPSKPEDYFQPHPESIAAKSPQTREILSSLKVKYPNFETQIAAMKKENPNITVKEVVDRLLQSEASFANELIKLSDGFPEVAENMGTAFYNTGHELINVQNFIRGKPVTAKTESYWIKRRKLYKEYTEQTAGQTYDPANPKHREFTSSFGANKTSHLAELEMSALMPRFIAKGLKAAELEGRMRMAEHLADGEIDAFFRPTKNKDLYGIMEIKNYQQPLHRGKTSNWNAVVKSVDYLMQVCDHLNTLGFQYEPHLLLKGGIKRGELTELYSDLRAANPRYGSRVVIHTWVAQ